MTIIIIIVAQQRPADMALGFLPNRACCLVAPKLAKATSIPAGSYMGLPTT